MFKQYQYTIKKTRDPKPVKYEALLFEFEVSSSKVSPTIQNVPRENKMNLSFILNWIEFKLKKILYDEWAYWKICNKYWDSIKHTILIQNNILSQFLKTCFITFNDPWEILSSELVFKKLRIIIKGKYVHGSVKTKWYWWI